MLQDLRHAFRILWQSKGWTAVVLLSLALGIGINTTLFSVMNTLLLKTISVPRPEELVRIRWSGNNQMVSSRSEYGFSRSTPSGESVHSTFSYSMFQALLGSNQTLSGLFACAPMGSVNLIFKGQAELASAFTSSGNYFQVLEIPVFVGRALNSEDDQPDAVPVAMVSHGFWQRRFGGDPGVIGTEVTINDVRVTLIGVTPPEYSGIQSLGDSPADVHLPLSAYRLVSESDSDRLEQATNWWLQILGRLKPGVTPEQVGGNLEGVFRAAARAGWDSYYGSLSPQAQSLSRNQGRTAIPRLDVASGARGVYDPHPDSARSISILGVVVILVLLIVCANVANLLLSRATARHKEISIRLSLGATRGRLIRQLLTESILLSCIGGSLALLVANWARRLLPLQTEFPLDWTVFAFAFVVSLATGLIFGLIPAFKATGVELAGAMKETSRNISRSRTLLGKSLLVVQVATSLVLLVGAGLFLRTLANLRSVDVGFNPENLLLVTVDPSVNRYDQDHTRLLLDQMKQEFQAVPGVLSVSLSRTALLAGSSSTTSIYVQGEEAQDREDSVIYFMPVSPEFFETLEIPLLLGRNLTLQDDNNVPRVAVINEAAARQYFPGGSPVGRRFGKSPESRGEIEVVGVVADAKYSSLRDQAPPTAYHSYLQNRFGRMTFELRTALDPSSIVPGVRQAARRVDSNLPLGEITTQAAELEERYFQVRLFAMAYSLFGGLALLLACIGLFGLMSYSVSRRSAEIGIRMALGAAKGGVVRMVLGESLLLVILGSAVGLAGALAAGRLISTLLYDLAPSDPVTILGAILVMILVSGIAGYLPARRASRVDPMVALRCD